MNSLRREYLDYFLSKYKNTMHGKVLDVGGKKISKRGSFIPPKKNIVSWHYLNIDESTNPDYCCSVEDMSIDNEDVDLVIMTELIEYLPKPLKAFKEIYRILKINGQVLVSSPFLNPLHGDYWLDRARYTPTHLKEMIESAGFKIISIEPMGSVGSVIFDILRISFGYASNKANKRISSVLLRMTKPLFRLIDKFCLSQKEFINTGYFVVIIKEK